MRLVLDTSAALGIILRQPGWETWEKAVRAAEWVEAPELFIAEAANACWKYCEYGELNQEASENLLEQALALPDAFVSNSELYREALALAVQGKRPAYDMFFISLARRNNAVLLTADKSLRAFAAKNGVKTQA